MLYDILHFGTAIDTEVGTLVYESTSDKGGHFAAWERPDVIATDLQNMFGKSGDCYKIVPGKSGY